VWKKIKKKREHWWDTSQGLENKVRTFEKIPSTGVKLMGGNLHWKGKGNNVALEIKGSCRSDLNQKMIHRATRGKRAEKKSLENRIAEQKKINTAKHIFFSRSGTIPKSKKKKNMVKRIGCGVWLNAKKKKANCRI